MKLNIGNKVSIVDEEGVFIIKQINSNQAIVQDSYGFESIYPLNKLIPITSQESIYDDSRAIPQKELKKIKNNKKYNRKKNTLREVDLHIGHLVEYIKDIPPHKMLEKQINQARIEVERAKKDQIDKLILIHGKGKGILKNEIYNLLVTIPNIEFMEADIVKYRFGAVEIKFK